MGDILNQYIPVADAIAALLQPHAEVVIHDIKKDALFHIANPFSGREQGDPSNLKTDELELDLDKDVIGPYARTGSRGQQLRSITSVLRDAGGDAVGLLCVNLDFSVLGTALSVLERFIQPQDVEARPEALFRGEWRETLLLEIRSFLKRQGLVMENLDVHGRKQLLEHLDGKGLFYARKSVEQVADYLGVSRATIYKDLQEIRKRTKSKAEMVVGL